ncbi:MAG TPA: hypothetical protein ENG98_02800 [Actinobacteria bacterium]|nr:hypothetical protein [Actinomycetota bacterium]
MSEPPPAQHLWGEAATPYDEIGGEAEVRSLVDRFYDEVDVDSPVLRAMLPRDMSVSRQKLFEFLCGWMGGPQLYVKKHGHPALRMRHSPFEIDVEAGRVDPDLRSEQLVDGTCVGGAEPGQGGFRSTEWITVRIRIGCRDRRVVQPENLALVPQQFAGEHVHAHSALASRNQTER